MPKRFSITSYLLRASVLAIMLCCIGVGVLVVIGLGRDDDNDVARSMARQQAARQKISDKAQAQAAAKAKTRAADYQKETEAHTIFGVHFDYKHPPYRVLDVQQFTRWIDSSTGWVLTLDTGTQVNKFTALSTSVFDAQGNILTLQDIHNGDTVTMYFSNQSEDIRVLVKQ